MTTSSPEYRSELRKRKKLAGVCYECNKPATHGVLCEYHNKKRRPASKRHHANRKLMTFFAYGGPVCKCCGESRVDLLTIDHINGDGAEHRKRIGKGALYWWLKRNNFPPGFQVLCWNCNSAKGYFGECPHVKERREQIFYTGIHNDQKVS